MSTPKSAHHDEIKPHYALVASFWAVGTVAVLIILKGYAYLESESTAVLASLIDSVSDAGISLMMLLAVRVSLKPADKTHRHGHGKVEGLAALLQAAFLGGAGVFLFFESLHRFADPHDVSDHDLAIAVAVMAIILSLILVVVQNHCLKKAPSLIIEADQAHYKTDILLNVSVITVLLIDLYGGPIWMDPASGLLIAGYFGWITYKVGWHGTDMLMDKELPDAVRERIEKIVMNHEDVHGMHDLRTRKSGMTVHISFDIEIDPDLSLADAHAITRDLEIDILRDFPYAEVMIHMDPLGDPHDFRHRVKGLHH